MQKFLKNKIFLTVIILAAVIFVAIGLFKHYSSPAQISSAINSATIRIGNIEIPVEVADTPEKRQKGLSGRKSLGPEKGMVFVFEKPDFYGFWMPEMNFAIDIIWINDGAVVGITEKISNGFDEKNPEIYYPPVPVKYVLEVNAGFAKNKNIITGSPVSFH